MKKIINEDLYSMQLFQSQIENQKLKIELAKSKIELLELNFKLSANTFNTYMKNMYVKYDLKDSDVITTSGEIIEQEVEALSEEEANG